MCLQCHAMGMACKYIHSLHGRNRTKARPKSPRTPTSLDDALGLGGRACVRAFVHGMYVVHPMSLGCVCHTEVSNHFHPVAHALGSCVRDSTHARAALSSPGAHRGVLCAGGW